MRNNDAVECVIVKVIPLSRMMHSSIDWMYLMSCLTKLRWGLDNFLLQHVEKDSQQDLSWLLIVIPIGFLIISFLLKLHKLLSLSLQRIDKTRKNFHQLLKTRSNLNHLEQLSLEMRYDLLDHLKLDNFKKLLSFSWWKRIFYLL